MELTINISKRKKSIFEFPIIGGTLEAIVSTIMIIVVVLAVIIVVPYDFIKHNILGYKRKTYVPPKPATLIETDNYKLTLEYIDEPNKEHQLASDFLYSIVDYGDENAVFKVINSGVKTELNDTYLTSFKYELGEFLILQKIRENENGEPTSDLIKFNPADGKIETLKEIGKFELTKFDEKNDEIVGFNLTEDITIKLNKASA
ncbi:hypothetical protein QVZ41_14205 [Wenyingzhuangia sp. chi5]|uniref:Uncharacterized protein n=1 Tax=Wenyingzhuangia gilva TaxID=3057677 RepID=A0ABT8VVM3_9FLAO|nr:hypothetical protein [Wenyingzhuangia sp. chi5]MDO3696001.1 hypothetical protein [Wenyingzhuangia sp. chi5]